MGGGGSETDVLIVGAGPTGLMMAIQLARRGVRPMIIDRNAGPSVATKALGVQARTLEIYSHLGIAERAVALGRKSTGANIWAAGRRAARVPLGDIGADISPFPYLLILGQDDNERLLGEVLRALGVQVRWSTELVGLEQDPGHAAATLRGADGSISQVRARWVAGCDGARSAARQLSGIEFLGAPYEHVFFVADTTATGPMIPGELNVYLWPSGFHLFFPMRAENHWRVVGILPPALREKEGLTFEAVAPSVIAEASAREGVQSAGLTFHGCNWFSTYRIHHRRAERFRDRRCFLLGDAAHIHSPVGAQGMNTGLQDAYNLAWKLALVCAGRAGEGLLDTYEAERIPVATRLLRTTDRAFAIVVSDSWLAGRVRTRIFPRTLAFAMKQDFARRFAFRTISQTGIRYPASPLSRTVGGAPKGSLKQAVRAGDRFPWARLSFAGGDGVEDVLARMDDTRFNLLVVGQNPPPPPPPGKLAGGFEDLVRIHVVAAARENDRELARMGIRSPAFYLVRPDGYVGLAGTRLDGSVVVEYLAECVGVGSLGRPADAEVKVG